MQIMKKEKPRDGKFWELWRIGEGRRIFIFYRRNIYKYIKIEMLKNKKKEEISAVHLEKS